MLFRLRKEARFLEKTKMDVSACQRSLDKAAMLISQGRYPVAIGLLSQIENDVKTAKSALAVEMMRLRESDMNSGKAKIRWLQCRRNAFYLFAQRIGFQTANE